MKKRLTACLLLLHSMLLAGGFQINTQGQKATAMGGSATGLALDASAAFFNPAALVKLDKNMLDAGVNFVLPSSTFLGVSGKSEDMKPQLYTPFSLYGSYRWKEKMVLGLSINTPFGLGTKWEDDWSGRYLAQQTRLNAIYIQPTLAYRLTDHWSVGAGPVLALGHAKLTRALPVEGADSEGQLELKGNGTGMGLNLAAFADYDKLTFGLSYRSGVEVKINKGDATFNNIPASLVANGSFPESATFKTGIKLPAVISLGVGFKASDKWLFHIEVNRTNWSVYDSLIVEFPDYSEFDSHSARKYKDVMAFRLGAQYQYNTKLQLRGGLAFDQSPVQDGYLNPELPDNNKSILSAGFSYQYSEKMAFDVSLMYESVRERKETANKGNNFNGTYKSNLLIAGIGIHYAF